MIKPAGGSFVGYKSKDWFAIDIETAKPLFYQGLVGLVGLPGVRDPVKAIRAINEGKPHEVIVHRSHLPLLTTPEALALLTPVVSGDWQSRDTWCEERGFKLRVAQQQGLDFIMPRRGTLLADEMRIGKTLQCLMAHDPARGPLVIAAPLSTRAVWLGWARRLWPDTPIGVLTGKKKINPERLKCPIVFCHYDILKHWITTQPVGTLILDEAHNLCNRDSERAKAISFFASRAEKVIAATGTPIWNMPPNLWNIIALLAPAAWGSYYDFGMRYGEPHNNGYGVEFHGATNVEELNARLTEVKIRRRWSDVQSDLPPISRNIVVAEVDETTNRRLDVLAATLKKERTNTAANIAIYRSQLAKIKLKTVVAEAKQILARGEPVVIWAWHREFATSIADALGEHAHLIHGEIASDKREAIMDLWKSRPNDALVATMAVAQVGIDLSHAHLAIFGELDYIPATIAQTEMRTYSPERPMNITFVVANHVVDQRLVRSLVGKLNAQDPFGFGSAVDAIDALREAFDGPRDDPDMERFLDDIFASGFEVAS